MDAGLGIILFLLRPGWFPNPYCCAALSIECSVLRIAPTAPSRRVQSIRVCTFWLLATIKIPQPGYWRYQPYDLLYCSWVIANGSFFDGNHGIKPPNPFTPLSYNFYKQIVAVRFGVNVPKRFKTLTARKLALGKGRKPPLVPPHIS